MPTKKNGFGMIVVRVALECFHPSKHSLGRCVVGVDTSVGYDAMILFLPPNIDRG